ncbi:helix-turn-helix domain-containing protein [Pseudonocardia nigra]|uniref:helix-turn-helix domain-containing protein n=1 Tax=Pseudonocardia nigra TaxID=1921578 RepID=UPI001C5DAF56
MSVREVAREFGVTERTAERWAARVRTDTGTSAATSGRRAEGSRGGHRAPLLISHTHALAGTRAAEGHRS